MNLVLSCSLFIDRFNSLLKILQYICSSIFSSKTHASAVLWSEMPLYIYLACPLTCIYLLNTILAESFFIGSLYFHLIFFFQEHKRLTRLRICHWANRSCQNECTSCSRPLIVHEVLNRVIVGPLCPLT